MGLFTTSLSAGDMARLCHNLATLYNGGVPLDRALRAVEESGGGRAQRDVARELRRAIAQGDTFAGAVQSQSKRFPPVFIRLVNVAEHSGSFAEVLSQLARYFEDQRRLYNAVIRQVAYPAAVLVAIAVGIPILKAFLSGVAGISDAPFSTQLGWILIHVGLRVGGAFFALVVAARVTFSMTTRESVLMYCWPLSGIVRAILLSRFAWAMMVLTRVGMPLHHAVAHAGRATGANRIARDFERIAPLLREGYSLGEACRQARFLPAVALAYIDTGELTGNLDDSFGRLSQFLYDGALFRLRVLIGLIGPLAILGLAAVAL